MSEKRLSDRLDAEMESLFPGCSKIRAKGWNLCMDDDLEGFYTVTKAELVTSGLPHRIELLAVMEGTIE